MKRSLAVVAMLLAACSSSKSALSSSAATAPAVTTAAVATSAAAATTVAPTTAAAPTTITTAPKATAMSARQIVEFLASDELKGRDNNTPGSKAARGMLVEQLSQFAKPAYPSKSGNDGFLQAFEQGTNVIAVVPGTDLADQYVVITAHYDHVGDAAAWGCEGFTADDRICNGATDDAAGVAVAVAVARSVATTKPRRSLLVALVDREEDGLLGSQAYLADPSVPAAKMVAAINFDIQGSDLVPSLAKLTVAVGAETGGTALVAATAQAAKQSSLNTVQLSALFGQGRADYANFVAAGVPTVFFTDSNSGCYHQVTDDVKHTDFTKLDQQLLTATALATDLASTDTPPTFVAERPPSTFTDAVSMLEVVKNAQGDMGLLSGADQATIKQYLADLTKIVEAGAGAFDADAVNKLLGGAIVVVRALSKSPCPAVNP